MSRGASNKRGVTRLGNVVAQCDAVSQVVVVSVWPGADVSTGAATWLGACRSAAAGAVSAGAS